MTDVVNSSTTLIENKKKVKHVYIELLALYKEAPKGEGDIWEKEIGEQYQLLMDNLIEITSFEGYSQYRVKVNSYSAEKLIVYERIF
ncbi:MAG: hypothetical protein NVS4B11_16690 [Ktedonobacteraceae bacterium]